MEVKCLMTASLAILACHPRTTIRCFSPKAEDIYQEKVPRKNVPSKSREKERSSKRPAIFAACCIHSGADTLPVPPHPIRTCRISNAVKELSRGEPSAQVLEHIFRSGWPGDAVLNIEKVLKINHNLEVLCRFEECRESVKSLRTMNGEKIGRLMVDGNELQGFIGTSITCSMGHNGNSSTCESKCCGVCRIICSTLKVGKRPITFYENTRIAHQRVTRKGYRKLKGGRTAILICRVIAGRIASYHKNGLRDGQYAGFDSVVRNTGDLVLFNQRAFLPYYVVIYKAHS